MTERKESATSTIAGIPTNRNSDAFRREQERELTAVQDRNREKEAQDRRTVTEETTQKTAELAREGVVARDFASEAVRKEMAESNRRAGEYAAVLQSSRETDEEKEIRERRERSLEADLMEEERANEAANEAANDRGAGGDGKDHMGTD